MQVCNSGANCTPNLANHITHTKGISFHIVTAEHSGVFLTLPFLFSNLWIRSWRWLFITSVAALVLVSPGVLLQVLASCRESWDAFDTLESNRSTCHIFRKYTVSLQCELEDELSAYLLWSNFYHRLSRGEAALCCESWGACWGWRIVRRPSHTDHSGNSSPQCVSSRVFWVNLLWYNSFRTLSRWKLHLLSESAYVFWSNIHFWKSCHSQNTRKAFCDSAGVPPAAVWEGNPSHNLHTHELLREIL